jgi:RNA polymerase sigma factor (sigma-70 family)
MTQAGWQALQELLLSRYGDLKSRLTRYLGSADLAGDALQDTWLRLQRGGELAAVRSPDTFILRTAMNIARDRLRSENRRVTTVDANSLLGVVDEAPDPAREIEGRADLQVLMTVMAELPARQKAILIAARLDGIGRREIAERFGVSVRFVQRELQTAQDYCADRLQEIWGEEFILRSRQSSSEEDVSVGSASEPRTPRTTR